MLQKDGKVMMGWDEIFQPDLPKDVVIQSWRGQKALAEAAKQGFQGILSNGYYIDLMHPASAHYIVDPLPADSGLTPEEQKRVLGGEATMWSEWVSPETIDSRIWPRTAAIAERLWSPQSVKDVDDMYRRLAITNRRLEELGMTQIRNQPMMLRRLVQSGDIAPLQTLVSIIEPVKEYRRYQVRPQTMLSSLTGLIDAAQADAPGARAFNRAVDEMLAGVNRTGNAAKIQAMINEWRESEAGLRIVMENSPALAEARQLAVDLVNLDRIAAEAMEALNANSIRETAWRDQTLKSLDDIAKQKAGVQLVVVSGVRKLVNAASGGQKGS